MMRHLETLEGEQTVKEAKKKDDCQENEKISM